LHLNFVFDAKGCICLFNFGLKFSNSFYNEINSQPLFDLNLQIDCFHQTRVSFEKTMNSNMNSKWKKWKRETNNE